MRWLIGLVTLLGVGCMRPTQAVMEDVSPYGWQEAVRLSIENGDTATLRDLSLVVRYNHLFRCDTLPLQITLLDPDSCYFNESVRLPIHHKASVAALRRVEEIPYRHHVVLNRSGEYQLVLQPLSEVEGIEAVGVNVVKSHSTSFANAR